MKRFSKTISLGKRLFAATAVVGALLIFAPWAAVARPPGGGLPQLIDQLELDASTQGEVDALLDAQREQRRSLHRELRSAREGMRSLMASADADEASLLSQAERIGALEQERHSLRIGTHLQLRTILTPDQMQALAAAKAERPRRGPRN